MTITYHNWSNALAEAEVLLLCFFFAWNFSRRKRFWAKGALSFLVFAAAAFFVYFIDLGNSVLSGTINYLIIFVFGCLALAFCFRMGVSTIVFCAIVAYTVRHLIYLCWQFSIDLYENLASDPILTISWVWVLAACVWALLFSPLIVYLARLIKKYPNVALPSWKIIVLSGLSLLVNNILNMFVITKSISDEDRILQYIICLFNILSSLMILVIMFGFVFQNNLEKEVASINLMRHEEEKQYQASRENIELINIKCHDLRKQIRALKEAHSTISQDEIHSIEEATRIYDSRVVTGNAALDVVLQEKSLICAKSKIVFDCIIDGSCLSFISESDVVSLFSNIIDNAIESVMKLSVPEKRVITLKIKKVPGGIFVYEENFFLGMIAYAGGLPVSTKGDNLYHGFGMKSIRMIVNHYLGDMQINSSGQAFRLSIFFPENS